MPATNAAWLQEQARRRQEEADRRQRESLVGRLVRLTHEIRTNDGDGFDRGATFRVQSNEGGRFNLVEPSTGAMIAGVVRPSFELVEAAA